MSSSKPPAFSPSNPLTSRVGSASKRRSTRIWLQIPLTVRMKTAGSAQIEHEGQTFAVNVHGGLLTLPVEVDAGQEMVLRNPATQMEEGAKVVRVERTAESVLKVAFAFDRPSPHFWGVAHPPDDWGIKKH